MEDRPADHELVVVFGPHERFSPPLQRRRYHLMMMAHAARRRPMDDNDDEWLLIRMHHEMRMEQEMLHRQERRRQEREERRRRRREEEERRLARPSPLCRGITSFAKEHSVFGNEAQFSLPVTKALPETISGLEKVIVSRDFDTKRLFLKRVSACIGWAVHGIVFEFLDNTRTGCILSGSTEERMELSDESIERRHGVPWHNVKYGDYIVGIHGNQLHNPALLWFCQTCVLEFASGNTIRFDARHEPWRGKPFSWKLPPLLPCLVYRVTFRHEQSQDMRGVVTSVHLPLSVVNMQYMPNQHQQTVQAILSVLNEVDYARESSGYKAFSNDLWWNILGWIRAWEMPVVDKESCSDEAQDSDLIQHFQNLSIS